MTTAVSVGSSSLTKGVVIPQPQKKPSLNFYLLKGVENGNLLQAVQVDRCSSLAKLDKDLKLQVSCLKELIITMAVQAHKNKSSAKVKSLSLMYEQIKLNEEIILSSMLATPQIKAEAVVEGKRESSVTKTKINAEANKLQVTYRISALNSILVQLGMFITQNSPTNPISEMSIKDCSAMPTKLIRLSLSASLQYYFKETMSANDGIDDPEWQVPIERADVIKCIKLMKGLGRAARAKEMMRIFNENPAGKDSPLLESELA